MTRRVSQNRLNTFRQYLELFRDLGHAHAVVEVIHNRVDRHTRTAQNRRAALNAWVDLHQGTL